MKHSLLKGIAAAGCAALMAGCLFPRYTTVKSIYPAREIRETMTLEQASAIARETIATPPAGRRLDYPGDLQLGKYTTSIRLRRHNRTNLILVEVREGGRVSMEFYVRTQAEGEKFAEAVWRLRREYREK